MKEREIALRTKLKHKNLSLIAFKGRVVFWHAVPSKGENKGQIVRLDNLNRVIYAVQWLDPIISAEDAFLVHPNVGAAMMRYGGALRDTVPSEMLRLRDMWVCLIAKG